MTDPRVWGKHLCFGAVASVPGLTWGLNPVPPHCPYRAGQWVAYHGYPGGAMPWERRGWRGVVLGYVGATSLVGVRDDGTSWAECWGSLHPDGVRSRSATPCVCCPPEGWYRDGLQRLHARPVQLDLLALLEAA